jgi:ribonuclease J
MKACIRGPWGIGGNCIELESQGYRVVLDVGVPVDVEDPENFPLPDVPGFGHPDPSLLGVILSHPHPDHYGLAYKLPAETPFLIGEAAHHILTAASLFAPNRYRVRNPRFLKHKREILLGPFKVIPYLVDHSAYDSYALLVEAEGKRVFYSGDFRAHGRKSRLTRELIASPPEGVSTLFMEGTHLGRTGGGEPRSEHELESRLAELLDQTEGLVLFWAAAQNIDRLVSLWKACHGAKRRRQFIADLYTAEVLAATGNARLPQSSWEGFRVFLPNSQRSKILEAQAFHISNRHRPARMFPEDLASAASSSVMLFRPGMRWELDKAECLKGARLIYSMWEGYLGKPEHAEFRAWLEQRQIPLVVCHTSGHAATGDLLRLRRAMPGAEFVPVHFDPATRIPPEFDPVALRRTNEWWEVPGFGPTQPV